MNIREKLIKLRDESNLSQQEFADLLNVSRQTVSRWEAGKSVPSSAQITNICRAFNIDANELLETPSQPAGEKEEAKPLDRKKILALSAIGGVILLALVGLIITIVYAVKDASYDSTATVWIVAIPQNTPMIVLSVILGAFIAVLTGLLIFLIRRGKK